MPKKKNRYEQYRSLFKSDVAVGVAPESVPVGNLEAVTTLFGDMEAIEFVNEVLLGADHKTDESSGSIVLTPEWAKSYADAVNKKPGFLYIKGHADSEHYAMRAIADGYIVGAKADNDRLLLRNRLLVRKDMVAQDLLEQTVRELKAGQLSTSTGDIQKRRIEFSEDFRDMTQFAIESVKNQTNAIVEHDMHASDASVVGANFRLGAYDDKGRLITTDDGDKNSKGAKEMEFNEYVEGIGTILKAGKGDMNHLTTTLGITVMNDEDKATLAKFKAVTEKIGGEDVDTFVTSVMEERKANFSALVDVQLKETFEEPVVLGVAKALFGLKGGTAEEIKTEVARLKELDEIVNVQVALASKLSHVSVDGGVGDTGNEHKSDTVEA